MDRKELGQRIRSKRLAMNLTQVQVAQHLGISRQAVNNYETGDNVPRDDVKLKLAKLLQFDLYELFFT